jgi:surface antigen
MHFKTLLRTLAAATVLTATSLQAIPLASGQPYWQCVPIARMLSGIQIIGDAHTWWGQAEGRYARGSMPRRGAVLAFKPHGSMVLGHVAAVSRIIDGRTILVTHSNWSPINGEKGQIERDVKVVDVSDAGDWSAVRVWYAPLQDLGSTAWPVFGFIYPDHKAPMHLPDSVAPAGSPHLSYGKISSEDRVSDGGPRPTGRLNYLAKMLKH